MSERQRHMLRLLTREPGSTRHELAAYAGCNPDAPSVYRSLARLKERGVARNVGESWFVVALGSAVGEG